MPDSVGAGGLPSNINVGHEHLDLVSGFTYQYQGDVPSNLLNWKIINGVSPTDPSVVGWGSNQLGATWYNVIEGVYKFWDGTKIQTIITLASLSERYKTSLLMEEDFISGSVSGGQQGQYGWATSGAGGTFSYVPSITPNIGLARLITGAVIGQFISIFNLSSINPLLLNVDHQAIWVIRLINNDLDIAVQLGLTPSPTQMPPQNGIYFEKRFADVTWQATCIIANVATTVDTGVLCDTNFHSFKYEVISGVAFFYIDNILVATISTNVYNGSGRACAQLQTNTTATKELYIDYFQYYVGQLVRA